LSKTLLRLPECAHFPGGDDFNGKTIGTIVRAMAVVYANQLSGSIYSIHAKMSSACGYKPQFADVKYSNDRRNVNKI
jgi:hypothetical protein